MVLQNVPTVATVQTRHRQSRGIMEVRRILTLAATLAGFLSFVAPAPMAGADAGEDSRVRKLTLEVMRTSDTEPDGTFTVSVEPGAYVDASGAQRTFAEKSVWTCILKTHNPHYSSGASGVIAKATVSCTGQWAVIPIGVYMMLGRTTQNSISSLKIVKESHYTRNVTVNGPATTWYVPRTGTGAKRGAYFRASSSAQPRPPLIPFNIPAHASAFVWVN